MLLDELNFVIKLKVLHYLAGIMTCQHCCGAESIFDQKSAVRDAKRYARKGPNKTTRSIINSLSEESPAGKTLLDIGGGIGVIQHEMLFKGLSKVTNVDASTAYQNKALDISSERGTADKISFLHGDFVDVADSVPANNFVTLERVVCCYPDVDKLITLSTAKAKDVYALVYPRDNFISRLLIKITHLYFWIKRNPFRTFVHSEQYMDDLIRENGFKIKTRHNQGIWRVAIYKRIYSIS